VADHRAAVTGPAAERLEADVVVVGSGGAGLMAVRHARRSDPRLRIVLLSKGLAGRSGCSVMAQGYNAALGTDDDPQTHFEDIVRGGAFLSDQALAWTLASDAPDVVRELADELGCAFDRAPDGAIELLPFPGNSRKRKIHRSHLTGLEILSRLRDDLLRTRPIVLEDTRALELVVGDRGVAGLVALDVRRGLPLAISAPVVVLAAGGSAAASYRVATPAREKSGDGLAMALRAGLALRDMEMVQFLSVGLATGASKLTGALLEEALRFAGAELRNAAGERFMARHDAERGEKAPRDVVARAAWEEIAEGRGTPEGGVLLDCRSIDPAALRGRFRDAFDRAALAGVDLAREPIAIAPAAHIGIGGIVIDTETRTELPGLLVAGEDAGGVHGASWAGGNGIAESTVFGRRAGRTAAALAYARPRRPISGAAVGDVVRRSVAGLGAHSSAPPGSPAELTRELGAVLWDLAGLRRDATGLALAAERVSQLRDRAQRAAVPGGPTANGAWQERLDLASRLDVAEAVIAAATAREETRGVHARADHARRDDDRWLRTVLVRRSGDGTAGVSTQPVVLDRLAPDASVAAR
jgi:succinate dehydrogenase / fumarate reductase flavoprotein subunit/fumarate reductase flavoprotein subunit